MSYWKLETVDYLKNIKKSSPLQVILLLIKLVAFGAAKSSNMWENEN
jgi:hypothetical protein